MNHFYKLLRLFAVVFFFASAFAFAQIPNADFENWTGVTPNGWSTSNIPSAVTNITQSSDAHKNSFAVQGVVASFLGSPWTPFLISGSNGRGFGVNAQHPALHGWYKFTPVGGDIVYASIEMLNAGSVVGTGAIFSPDLQTVYQEFVLDIIYGSSVIPDTCIFLASITDTSGSVHLGSTFFVDDLSFGPLSAVDDHGNVLPKEFELFQNFPNPFNPSTFIQYSIPEARRVHLGVFDVLGREVATLVDQRQSAGSYRAEFNGSNLPSGIYFYQLQAGEFSSVKKFMLVK